MMELTPKQIVSELDRYIIGQSDAKKAVAIALRNRYRRRMLAPEMREEITPKNIIMKGPTGVGKTEIARRLAKLVNAPFVKVEATKYTEVGYVGRDVESMVRDLVEAAIRLIKDQKMAEVEPKAREMAEGKLFNAILPAMRKKYPEMNEDELREKVWNDLRSGNLNKIPVEIEIEQQPQSIQLGPIGMGGADNNFGEVLSRIMPKQRKKKKINIGDALKLFTSEEANKMIDQDTINYEGLRLAEQEGIIFIDEIDKIASKNGEGRGPDVSREGVQRDILPIVEGCTVSTKYGNIKTDFILFIAAGAFHIAKVSDLIPELQGRFPVQVELQSLTEDDFKKIIKEPDNAIIMQYAEMLKVENVDLKFTEDAISEIAHIAFLENENKENIGARRLHTVFENLLEELSYEAGGENAAIKEVIVDREYVQKHLDKALKALNLRKYIL
ncbi:MAG TPA: ATP-dependent protease ATPase subunit HslU [Clostridia bacterium]|nr:ATP-dependent protease ATPase subunit HslU [Clostridia bacterium]